MSTPELTAERVPTVDLDGPRNQRLKDSLFRAAMLSCLTIAIVTLIVLLAQIVIKGAGSLSVDFFTNYASSFPENAGIRAALLGTLWLMGVCAAFIVPVGVATAVYLEEYADHGRWYNRFIEVNIQNLAAVPSIIYGILGLAFLVRGPLSLGRVVLAGGLTLGLLVLPVVIIAGREAIRAVPPSIREGSMALGATKWQTIWKQVLPASISGIATGVILALSRAIGETAPLILLGAPIFIAFDPHGLNSEFTAMPLQAFNWLSQPQDEFKNLAAAAIVVLMGVLLLTNALAIYLRNRYEQKW
jgi:phosphate transport system permease protein